MNRRIYWNDKFIEFSVDETQSSQHQSIKINDGGKSEKKLKEVLKTFLDVNNPASVHLQDLDFEASLNYLKKEFRYIEAAGGFIEKNGEFLFIRRHNLWDLPKGKLEKGESPEDGAIRECEEECAIKNLHIIQALPSTFHIYNYKGGYALKQAFWFYMKTDYAEKLIPQLEESITEVRWCSRQEIETEILKDTYYTIADVTQYALKLQPTK